MPHTGDSCTKPGLFECTLCHQTVRMLGNLKDKFPPCPKCKSGVHYLEINLEIKDNTIIKKAVVGSND